MPTGQVIEDGTLSRKVARPLSNQDWQGGKKDERLYGKVRAEKQKVIRKKYDQIKMFLDEIQQRQNLARTFPKLNCSRLFLDGSSVARGLVPGAFSTF